METTKNPHRSLPFTTLDGFLARCATFRKSQKNNRFLHPNRKKASLPAPGCETLPPLLVLPVEIKLEIISSIPHDRHPTLACLRRTHSSFLNLIPKATIRSKLSRLALCDQLLTTETHYAYLLPPDHYPCHVCARVLPTDAFPFDLEHKFAMVEDPPYHWPQSCKKCVAKEVVHRIVHLDVGRGGLVAPPATRSASPIPQDSSGDNEGGVAAAPADLKQWARDQGTKFAD